MSAAIASTTACVIAGDTCRWPSGFVDRAQRDLAHADEPLADPGQLEVLRSPALHEVAAREVAAQPGALFVERPEQYKRAERWDCGVRDVARYRIAHLPE